MSLVLNLTGGGGGSILASDAILRILAPYGSSISVSIGGSSKSLTPIAISGTQDVSAYYEIVKQASFGAATISATLGNDTVAETVSISAAGEYTVTISFWNGQLYVSGNQYTEHTGGWAARNVKTTVPGQYINAVYPVLDLSGSTMIASVTSSGGANNSGSVLTVGKIDLTDYDTITYVVNHAYPNNRRGVTYYVTSVNTAGDSAITASVEEVSYDAGDQTITLDVSSLSGEYYVGFNLLAGSSTTGGVTVTVASIICS